MLTSLSLENFRNFSHKELQFTSRSFITGPNGSGKSSILESIRILSVGKSFRTSRIDEAIYFESRFFRLKAIIQKNQNIELFYGNQFETQELKDRRLTFQGNQVSWTEFLGQFPTVLFTPNDLEVILGGPDVRRKYLDSVLWQVSAEYRRDQLEFWQVLRERAALLFMVKINRASSDELQPWNELVTKLTKTIREARLKYVQYLNEWFTNHFKDKSGRIETTYKFDPKPIGDFFSQEVKLAQNLFGAHRDELVIKFDDFSARKFASRGQSRLVVAHLKAAEADYLLEKTKNTVTVLLDDAMSELDKKNTLRILELFSDQHQIILTSAESLELTKEWSTIKL
ncbi:MAG: DNA replication and repair protein RecF [Candidatus Berkelbacteria bacterium]|nr:DNA replication and repair protein RecF [Candidatus Berkelbacteria bacterium]